MTTLRIALAVAGMLGGIAAPAAVWAQAQEPEEAAVPSEAFRSSIAAVMLSAPDAPAEGGYLEIAQTEIAIALRELGSAGHAFDNLAEIKRRVSRATHALSPSIAPDGPGLGMGALPAVDAVIVNLQRAANAAEPEREDVRLAATPAVVAAQTARERVFNAARLGPAVAAAESAEEAREVAARMTRLLTAALSGLDTNNDGEVSWNLGEGGLYHTHMYANMMALGSGLAAVPQAAQTRSQ